MLGYGMNCSSIATMCPSSTVIQNGEYWSKRTLGRGVHRATSGECLVATACVWVKATSPPEVPDGRDECPSGRDW
jgi:hypothetical protein